MKCRDLSPLDPEWMAMSLPNLVVIHAIRHSRLELDFSSVLIHEDWDTFRSQVCP